VDVGVALPSISAAHPFTSRSMLPWTLPPPSALKRIRIEQPSRLASAWNSGSAGGASRNAWISGRRRSWPRPRRVLRTGPPADLKRVDTFDVTLHDPRRTFGSVAARMGYPELFIAALLGHKAVTVTQVYARLVGDPLHEAAEAIGAWITNLMGGVPR